MEPRSEGGTGGPGGAPERGRAPQPVAAGPGSERDARGPGGPVLPRPSAAPAIRASDTEREDVLRRLQDAFAEGRLDDDEFDSRMRAALSARTRTDLDGLLADLPAVASARPAVPGAALPSEGRYAIAIKGSVRRAGRWRVPHRLTTFAYKGGSQLDLRAAELTAQVTAIRAVGYKSDVQIIVPPG